MATRQSAEPAMQPRAETPASPPVAPDRIRTTTGARLACLIAAHWLVLLVLGVFAATAFVVPVLAPVATTDDWGYTRSVEILLSEGRLTVLPAVAATAVFQILWGAGFGLVFGMTLGVMRLATVAIVLLGGGALYALLGELGAPRNRAALGVACFLFNPLAFSLAFTFMTDPYFTVLLIAALFAYVRGLRPDREQPGFVVLGSAFAACALLARQQGVLIPLAVGAYLLFARRLRFDRGSLILLARVGLLPAFTLAAYVVWLSRVNRITTAQTGFFTEAVRAGWSGAWLLTRNLSFIELMYLGAFCLPLLIALLPGLPRAMRTMTRSAWLLFVAWSAVLAAGLIAYAATNRRWPYIPQFVGAGGLGPPDVLGSRPRLVSGDFFTVATIVCAVCAVVLALLLSRGLGAPADPARASAGLVLAVGAGQVIGVLPPSFHYLHRGYSLDRYLLPLLPIVICLLVWATRDLPLWPAPGWLAIAVLLAFDVAGVRDYLVYLETVWTAARQAVTAGAPLEKLDAGAAWDGYHLYTRGLAEGIGRARTPGGPWWTTFYAPLTDSSWVVSSKLLPGYLPVRRLAYDSWLLGHETPVFLLRRIGLAGPP